MASTLLDDIRERQRQREAGEVNVPAQESVEERRAKANALLDETPEQRRGRKYPHLQDMVAWVRDPGGARDQIARKHLGSRALAAGRYDPERNAIFDEAGEQIFPTKEMVEQYDSVAREELQKQADTQPSIDLWTRFKAGLPFSEKAQKKVAADGGIAVDTADGTVIVKEGEKAKFADKPPMLGQILHGAAALFPPAAVPSYLAAEYFSPGAAHETAGDLADLSGPAVEVTPQALGEIIARRTGFGLPGRTAIQSGAGAAGTYLRRLASHAAQPGEDEDIGATETAEAAALSAGMAGAGELGAAALAKGARHVVSPEHRIRSLLGEGIATTDEAKALDEMFQGMGLNLDPAALTLSEEGRLLTEALRRLPGGADDWAKLDVENVIRGVEDLNRQSDRILGSASAPETVGRGLAAVHKKKIEKLRGVQLEAFGRGMDDIIRETGNPQTVRFDTLRKRAQELQADAHDEMDNVIRSFGRFRVAKPKAPVDELAPLPYEELRRATTPEPEYDYLMTPEQMKNVLSDYSQGRIPGTKAGYGTDDYLAGELRRALAEDLDILAKSPDPIMARAGQKLQDIRQTYKVMQRPIDRLDTNLAKQILGHEKAQDWAFSARELLRAGNQKGATYSGRQLRIFAETTKETSPGIHQRAQRAMWDAALEDTGVTPTKWRGKQILERAKQEGDESLAKRPAAIAKNLRQHRRALEVFRGEKIPELDGVIDAFERLALVDEALAKSPTAALLSSDKLFKSAMNVILNPKDTLAEMGVKAHRKSLTSILTDPAGRRSIVELDRRARSPNFDQRAAARIVNQLLGIMARDATMFGDDDDNPALRFEEEQQ